MIIDTRICSQCPLAIENDFKIPEPYGNIHSKFFIVMEAPGYKEKKTGKVATGKAGLYLQYKLQQANLLNFCYITNVVKCRPPKNRTPTDNELAICKPLLYNELLEGKPRIILLLGNTAIASFYNKSVKDNNIKVSKLHGKILIKGKTIIIHAYHPSYILRNPQADKLYTKLFKIIQLLYRHFINQYV